MIQGTGRSGSSRDSMKQAWRWSRLLDSRVKSSIWWRQPVMWLKLTASCMGTDATGNDGGSWQHHVFDPSPPSVYAVRPHAPPPSIAVLPVQGSSTSAPAKACEAASTSRPATGEGVDGAATSNSASTSQRMKTRRAGIRPVLLLARAPVRNSRIVRSCWCWAL
jgi:hypothetical protein